MQLAGTIRGDLATTTTENLVHASDGHESAAREIALLFPSRVDPSLAPDCCERVTASNLSGT